MIANLHKNRWMYIHISFTSSSSNSTTSLTSLSCHGLSSLQSPQPTSDSYPRRLCERKINQYRDDILSNLWNAVFWPGIYICLNKFTIRIPLFFLKVIVCLTSQLLYVYLKILLQQESIYVIEVWSNIFKEDNFHANMKRNMPGNCNRWILRP